jgi:hypothetical protein
LEKPGGRTTIPLLPGTAQINSVTRDLCVRAQECISVISRSVSTMKKLLTLMFAIALSMSLSSFAYGQDKMDDKKMDKKEDKMDKKEKKAHKKEKKADKKDDMKKDDKK